MKDHWPVLIIAEHPILTFTVSPWHQRPSGRPGVKADHQSPQVVGFSDDRRGTPGQDQVTKWSNQIAGQSESCATSDNVLPAGLRTIGLVDPIWVTRPSVCPSLYPFLSTFLARHRPFIRPFVFPPSSRNLPFFLDEESQPGCNPCPLRGLILFSVHVLCDRIRSLLRSQTQTFQTISLNGISANVRISDFDIGFGCAGVTRETVPLSDFLMKSPNLERRGEVGTE